MKKFIYSFAVIAALGLVACGGSKTEEAAAEAPVEVEEVEAVIEAEPADSCAAACDSTCCAEAAETAEAVVAE